MKRKILVVSIIVICILTLTSLNTQSTVRAADTTFTNNPNLKADPSILIDEDSDFLAFPGDGNETHPYLIQGYDIDSSAECNIHIANTTKYFVVQNNNLYGTSDPLARILIENVAPGTAKIVDNECDSCLHGILAKDSYGLNISDNFVHDQNDVGIKIENCSNSILEENAVATVVPIGVFMGEYCGMIIKSSSNVNITKNSCHHCYYGGIYVVSSTKILVKYNKINHNFAGLYKQYEVAGLYLNGVSNSKIINNTLTQNAKNNLYVLASNNIQIENNTFDLNTEGYGLNLKATTDTKVIYNKIENSPGYGLTLHSGSNDNIIHHNHFTNNNPGSGSQAADYCANNVWYDSTTNEGNWWNDWAGGDYIIDGSASSADPYPLGTPIIVPEFSLRIGLLLLAVPIFSVMIIVYQKKR